MTADFSGGAAVITGSAGGIGLGIAKACIARGMSVVLSDVDEERLAVAAESLCADGAKAVGQRADVRELAEVVALRDRALSEFGHVDLVCNNAGLGFTTPLVDVAESDWELMLDVNVVGVANGIAAFLPHFLEQDRGHLNATSSLSGLQGDPGLGVYNATKFAVVGVMESLAGDLAEAGSAVTASVLCPGPVATDLVHSSATHTGHGADQAVDDYLNRGLAPDEVGEFALSGIEEGRFWLITHPELTFAILDGRLAAMKDGGQHYLHPAGWTDQ